MSHADQAERDRAAFIDAIRNGRIEARDGALSEAYQ